MCSAKDWPLFWLEEYKKEPHCVAHAEPYNYEQQNALRTMINAGFRCPKCKGSIRRYWPYDKGNK